MDIKEIGWTSFFSKNFEPYRKSGLVPSRVFSEQKKSYLLYGEERMLTASARGILWHKMDTKHDVPVVGDWVVVEILGKEGNASIKAVLPRKSQFSRLAAGARKKRKPNVVREQVIAANIDVAIVVTGLDRDYNIRRIERYMTLVYSSGARPVVILNKADLCTKTSSRKKDVKKAIKEVPVHSMTALNRSEVKILHKYIKKGQTAALLGSSGVGKSTIINQLLGEQRQKVVSVSLSEGKGKHTTSRRELIPLPGGGLIMDNPGMREIQLWSDESVLSKSFEDIDTLAQECRFNDCSHLNEPDCAVKKSIEQGRLDPDRLENYIKMKAELLQLKMRKKP